MDSSNLGLGIAFLGGLASFLSPCVFALVPAYIGYLSGRSVGSKDSSRFYALSHGIAFVLGFSTVFILLGLGASAVGSLLFDLRPYLTKIGGVVVVLFGLHMTGIIRIPYLQYDVRKQDAPDKRFGYLSSFFIGRVFLCRVVAMRGAHPGNHPDIVAQHGVDRTGILASSCLFSRFSNSLPYRGCRDRPGDQFHPKIR